MASGIARGRVHTTKRQSGGKKAQNCHILQLKGCQRHATLIYTPYSKMAAILVFFCLLAN